MTTISALKVSTPTTVLSVPRPSAVVSTAERTDTSDVSTVTLGKSSVTQDYPLYSAPAKTAPVIPAIWEKKQNDLISNLMAGNFSTSSLASRFHNLGAAMLSRFNIDSSDFSQSVQQPTTSNQTDAALQTVIESQLHTLPDNQITLNIQTSSRVQVALTLGSQEDGMAVKIKVSNGILNDAERDALENLSQAFQKAIDGLTANPPKLNLGGLTQFDSAAITSIDLHASLNTNESSAQSIDFHADSKQRTVKVDGPSGSMKIDVDLTNPVITGTTQQHSQAISRYLKQFDDAANRGNGDASLMSMFKDAFSEMNSNYGSAQQSIQSSLAISLDDADHAMLTGLADFSASMTQKTKSPNPMRAGETDNFSYQVSQTSSVYGNSQLDRAISQQQQSHLTAAYHQPLFPGSQLQLSSDLQSQNYYYRQINDSASATVNIAYNQGKLVQASLDQSASKSTRVSKYVSGILVSDITTPSQATRKQDFLSILKNAITNSSGIAADGNRWQQELSLINHLIYLETDPGKLRAEKS